LFLKKYDQQLILSELEINFGNPPKKLNLNPSCSVVLFQSVSILSQPMPYTFQEIISYLSSSFTQISQNYDYFYSYNNPGKLISDVQAFQQAVQITNNNGISPDNPLSTIYLDLPFYQLTISFFLKFLQIPPSKNQYFCIDFDQNQFCVQFYNNQIFFGGQQVTYNTQEWNNIILIKSNIFIERKIILIINNTKQLEIPDSNFHYLYRLRFFSYDVSYQLDLIRIYSGSILFYQNNCYLESTDGSCLVCMDNYLIDFQNKAQCVLKNTTNTDNLIKGVKDWNPPRKLCPQNMINDSSSQNSCKCLIGYYLAGDNCIKCPSYCRNCNSLNDCSKIRDSLGNCLDKNAFDDGQNCITPFFILKERQNIRISNQPDYGQLCSNMDADINKYILSSSQLNIKASDSIFFSFSILVKQFNLVPNQEIKIAYIEENLNLAWIAFWTDNLNCIFMVRTKVYNYYDQSINCQQLYRTSNLKICRGKCDSIINGFCLVLNNKQITFIKNIPNPTLNGVDLFFSIYQNDSELFGSLVYPNNNYGGLFSISFTIEFNLSDKFEQQFNLLQIVCYWGICQTLKNAVLFFNQSNFFFLHAKVEDLFQLSIITQYKIDVICNYIKESFQSRVQVLVDKIVRLKIGDPQYHYQLFIDNINIYQRNVFVYYDYTKFDSCFVYINLKVMKCLYLKRDYLYYKNQIITKQQCIQQFLNTVYTPYIIQKDQTCNIKVPQNYEEYLCGLIEYINGQPLCTVCKDDNADPLKKCLQCKQYFFFNKQTSRCQKCDLQCLECENQSNNCTSCQFSNQITPTCNCIQQKNKTNMCQCNYKCGSCSSIDNNICITCSSERRVLPNCQCDKQYQEVQQECVEIKVLCSDKCLSCIDFSDNCTKCSINRVNPPSCQCIYGYQELIDGSCQICQQGTYYDPQLKICKKCSTGCLSCSYQQCLQCMSGFQNVGFICNCTDQLYQQENLMKCLNSFDVQISSFYQNKTWFISLNFNQVLKQFNISDSQLNKIITFYIPEISQESYSFVNAKYIGNQFLVSLKIKANFQASKVFVILNTNYYFQSSDGSSILNKSFLQQRMSVDIGPLFLKEENQKSETLDHFQSQLNQFINQNQNAFKAINQLQLIFYFLNTLQPITAFLLLNASYPPQLYKFYQIAGTFIFPRVPNYQDNNPQMEFSVFGYNIDRYFCEIPDYGKFNQLGFCQSILKLGNLPIATE
ncbi:bowman-birk serine protease inhibitor family protein, partial (macronuclear) [Tetrahymena thermophila SB210]